MSKLASCINENMRFYLLKMQLAAVSISAMLHQSQTLLKVGNACKCTVKTKTLCLFRKNAETTISAINPIGALT